MNPTFSLPTLCSLLASTLVLYTSLATTPITTHAAPSSPAQNQIIYVRPIEYAAGSLNTLDPPTETHAFLIRQIFDTLVDFGPSGDLIPRLLESWTVLKGGEEFILNIHPEARFHDGSRVTSKDVKHTIELISKPGSFTSSEFKPIQEIQIETPTRLKLRISKPDPGFLERFTDTGTAIVKFGQTSKQLNGTGAFKVASRTDAGLELVKNKTYYRGPAKIDVLKVPVYTREQAIQKFKDGEADDLFQYFLSREERESLKPYCRWHYALLPTFRFTVFKDGTHAALKDRADRECLLSLVNRATVVEKMSPGSKPMPSYLPREVVGGQMLASVGAFKVCKPEQLDRLRKLTQDAPLVIGVVRNSELIGDVIGAELAKAGLGYKKSEPLELEAYFKAIHEPRIQIYSARYTPRSPSAESYLGAFVGEVPFWPLGVFREEFSPTLKNIQQMADPKARQRAVAKTWDKIGERRVLLPLFQFEFNGCAKPRWGGLTIPAGGVTAQRMDSVMPDRR